MLKDIVLDVAKNIASLGTFDEILVEQDTDTTKFTAYPEDSSITVLANSKAKVDELPEACGMLNLGFLVGLSGLYRTDFTASNLSKTAGNTAGVHLISNPYMAYLDWQAVTKTNIEPTFYIRTNNTTNSNISALISYNSETSLSTNTSKKPALFGKPIR